MVNLKKFTWYKKRGFEEKGGKHIVCKIKVFYGLQQTPRAWYSNIDSFIQQHGLQKIET
jgi:hypothetical protein